MKKEIIFVILIGIIIGIIIAFGIYTAQSALKNKPGDQDAKINSENATPTTNQYFLEITEPEDEIVTDIDKILVAGNTSPNAVIAIISPENEYLFVAEDSGHFSSEVELTGGANQITISSFDVNGNKNENTITVIYSTADI